MQINIQLLVIQLRTTIASAFVAENSNDICYCYTMLHAAPHVNFRFLYKATQTDKALCQSGLRSRDA